jgi:hypothetical protein
MVEGGQRRDAQAITTVIVEVARGLPKQESAIAIVAMKDMAVVGRGERTEAELRQAVRTGIHHEVPSHHLVGRIGGARCHRQCSILNDARVVRRGRRGMGNAYAEAASK